MTLDKRLAALLAIFALTFSPYISQTCVALDKTVSLLTKEPIGELAVGGRLAIDLHAEFMVSRTYEKDTVLNWYNCGYSGGGRGTQVGGNFGDFGFQVPYQERDTKYPRAVSLDQIRAVRFTGGQTLKGNFEVKKILAGTSAMVLEVWLRSPAPRQGDVILGWQSRDGKETSGVLKFPKEYQGNDKWRHIVVNCTPAKEDWYLDGRQVFSGERRLIIQEGYFPVLGGAALKQPSFQGDLVAVRLHDATMSEAMILHNFQGGVMLGTRMHNWWRNEPDKWYAVESEHFRHCVDKEQMKGWSERQTKEFQQRIPGMFDLAELIYHTYSERLALRSSVVSRRPEKRGDGIKYKIPIQPSKGSWMGVNDDFGWACQGEGHINPHELVHGWDAMTGGMAGNFWEAHANWPQTYNGIYQTMPPGCVSLISSCCPASGRSFYHDRLMFEHLAQTPYYGPMFIAKLWYDGPTKTSPLPYPWIAFNEINPYPEFTLADEYTRMAMKNVTWDYVTYVDARGAKGNTGHGNDGVVSEENLYARDANANKASILRYARIILEKIPYEPGWWRVPREQAPQQLGWNICPLQFRPGKVSANLIGYVHPQRGSDWRAAFVGVDTRGKPVYGTIFGPGKTQEFEVREDIKELYLVVCGTPTNIMAINMVGDFRSFEQELFPYKVKFQGCEPMKVPLMEQPRVPGKPHENGGGFVASSAKVEAGAYVEPGALVLGNSVVSGKARIEDHAVVNNATVAEEAIISGHALVEAGSTVRGRARVRDYAKITQGSTVEGDAKVLEHAWLENRKCAKDLATIKGVSGCYGNASGTVMIDGFYAKSNEATRGKWFTWAWGKGKNPGEVDEDFGGLYADYDFAQPHPWKAVDSFGVAWGYLVNSPELVSVKDREKVTRTLLKPEAVLQQLEIKPTPEHNYVEQLSGYLLPPKTGNYVFWIAADDEGEFWLGEAGSSRADRKICSNPFFAPFREFKKYPAQKSAMISLEQGKAYPFKILHGNGHMAGSLSVAWTVPGTEKMEIVGCYCLALKADGKQKGVRQQVWGGTGKIADLIKRSDYPEGFVRERGLALRLNGVDQFVDLPRDLAAMRNCTYTAEFCWTGEKAGARIFEFANEKGDAVWMSPEENGKLVFAIRKGKKVEMVAGPAIRKGVWTTVRAILEGPRASLYVDGVKVAQNPDFTLVPDMIRATQAYLGRGLEEGYYAGLIGRFTVHSVPRTE